VFVPGKPFQQSLMFLDKTRGLPQSVAPERCYTWVGSGLTRKHLTKLERLGRGKHSSLLQKSTNYGRKKFYSFGCGLPAALVTNNRLGWKCSAAKLNSQKSFMILFWELFKFEKGTKYKMKSVFHFHRNSCLS
jgi:hypothetical protein